MWSSKVFVVRAHYLTLDLFAAQLTQMLFDLDLDRSIEILVTQSHHRANSSWPIYAWFDRGLTSARLRPRTLLS